MHRGYYGAVEREKKNMTLQTLERIASSLGVEPAALFAPHTRSGEPEGAA